MKKAMAITTGEAESGNVELYLRDAQDNAIAVAEIHRDDVPQFAATILSIVGEEELAQVLSNEIYNRCVAKGSAEEEVT